MKKVAILAFSIILLGFSNLVEGFYDPSPKCYRQLQYHFFEPYIVQQALSLQGVPQNTWLSISEALREKTKDVPMLIRQKARKMYPNPLKKPYNSEVALGLLESALYEVLVEVLSNYSVQNTYAIHQIFEYIKSQHLSAWNECFGSIEKNVRNF